MAPSLILWSALVGCDELQATLIEAVPVEYEAQGAPALAHELRPSWEGPLLGSGRVEVVLHRVATGFPELTDMQFPPGRDDLALVAQKGGRLSLLRLADGSVTEIHQFPVQVASELGLLGLAFHPRWPEDPRLFVHRNPEEGLRRSRIASFPLSPDLLRLGEETVLLEVTQPYPNHDAGQLAFGPDGMLYIGLGDGGSGGDPKGHGQDASTLLGSMLRIDVDRTDADKAYGIPADNPFLDGRRPTPSTSAAVPPETWAIGLRNPWRYSFDPQGRLVVADVGQNLWEEVSLVSAGDNLGWKLREGRHCYPPEITDCPTEGMVDPVFEYAHTVGNSITGGYVFLSETVPGLKGRYLVGDFAQGRIWALALPEAAGQDAEVLDLGRFPILISTFGRDASGQVYVGDYQGGAIYRIDGAPAAGATP